MYISPCVHTCCLPACLLEYVLLAQARPTMSCIALVLVCTVAEKYIRVFRSWFAVCRHLCLAFYVPASRLAVRASRFAVCSNLCLAFHVRASRFALSHSRFVEQYRTSRIMYVHTFSSLMLAQGSV